MENIRNLLVNNGFKKNSKIKDYYTKNNCFFSINNESLYLKISGMEKQYHFWQLNQYPNENELKNFLFFSSLKSEDKNYLFKKIDERYNKPNFRTININNLLNFEKEIDLIEKKCLKTIEINAFNKRKAMYNFFEVK